MLKFLSGLVSLFNSIMQWINAEKLIQTGEDLQKGRQDEKTLEAVKKADDARRNADDMLLDSELRIDKTDIH